MRIGAALALLAALACTAPACGRGDFFRLHEYEEEIDLSLDGSAIVDVNASVAALNALRGSSFDTAESALIDRDAVRAFFTTPVTTVTRTPSLTRRGGRRFVHVRMAVADITQLSAAAPFAWSTYTMTHDGGLVIYRQHVGAGAGQDAGTVGWTGNETVSFRAHMPSRIVYHNAGPDGLRRGNILVWEQSLRGRLAGEPLDFEARMESQSILSRTLILFGSVIVLVALTFAAIVWWTIRKK